MKKPKKPVPANDAPPGNHNGNGRQNKSCGWPPQPGAPNLQRDEKLIEQVRQIIAETPEVRPEKVEPLREAVASETYEIDARKLANSLITKIILES
jgi:anti-sigma28 factor (negative regulator of flagellin synthesis)